MKFSYSKKRLYINLILGFLWFGIGLSYFFTNEKIRWNVYVNIILGIIYIAMFVYDYTQKYFEITKDKIKIKSIPEKQIEIDKIIEVKYFADEYIFKTANKTLKIMKSQIKKEQLPEFENFYNKILNELKKNVA